MPPIVVLIYLLLLLVSNALCYKPNTSVQASPVDRDDNNNNAGNIPIAELTLNDIAKLLEHNANGESPHQLQSFIGQQYRINNDDSTSNIRSFVVPRWIKFNGQTQRSKRSLRPSAASSQAADELRAYIAATNNELGSNELLLSDELMNAPLSQLNVDLLERSPQLLKLIRKCEAVLDDSRWHEFTCPKTMQTRLTGLLYYLQVKRNLDYNPRLGRRSVGSVGSDDCNEFQQHGSARCVGKKDMQYTPRLGRRSG